MIIRPFQDLQDAKQLAVVWLNSSDLSTGNVPKSWCHVWNSCLRRYCVDGAANLLRELCQSGRTKSPHVISGDMDSITVKSVQFFEQTSTQIQRTPDQDYTDLTKALNLIVETDTRNVDEAKAVLILGGLHGRFDHTLGTLNSVQNFVVKNRLPVYVVDSINLVTILPAGSTEIHVERKCLTGKCGLLPLCQRETRVTSRGFKWNLNDQLLEYGGVISSCNEAEADCLHVEASAPIVFTCELKDADSFLTL